MSREVFRTRLRVRLDDVDAAHILYFPRQVHFFVVALEDFFREALQLDWPTMLERENISMPTVDLKVTYKTPLYFGQECDIAVRVKQMGRTSATFAYEMTRVEDGALTTTAEHTVVFINAENFEPIPIPDRYRQALNPYWIERRSEQSASARSA